MPVPDVTAPAIYCQLTKILDAAGKKEGPLK